MPLFSRLDTVILRVRDLAAAQAWYAAKLDFHPVFADAEQGLAACPSRRAARRRPVVAAASASHR